MLLTMAAISLLRILGTACAPAPVSGWQWIAGLQYTMPDALLLSLATTPPRNSQDILKRATHASSPWSTSAESVKLLKRHAAEVWNNSPCTGHHSLFNVHSRRHATIIQLQNHYECVKSCLASKTTSTCKVQCPQDFKCQLLTTIVRATTLRVASPSRQIDGCRHGHMCMLWCSCADSWRRRSWECTPGSRAVGDCLRPRRVNSAGRPRKLPSGGGSWWPASALSRRCMRTAACCPWRARRCPSSTCASCSGTRCAADFFCCSLPAACPCHQLFSLRNDKCARQRMLFVGK